MILSLLQSIKHSCPISPLDDLILSMVYRDSIFINNKIQGHSEDSAATSLFSYLSLRLPMALKVGSIPSISTCVAKLIFAPAGHVVAPLLPLHYKSTLMASPEIEVFTQYVSPIVITPSRMIFCQALWTVFFPTYHTRNRLNVCDDVTCTT